MNANLPTSTSIPFVFSENDTIDLAELLVCVAKEQPITDKQRRFAAMLFIRMERVVKVGQSTSKPSASVMRPDLRRPPIFSQHKRKGRR